MNVLERSNREIGLDNGRFAPDWIRCKDGFHDFVREAIEDEDGGCELSQLNDDESLLACGGIYKKRSTESASQLKTHLRVTGVDYRTCGQTEFEYSHQAKCGYVRDLVSWDINDVTCKLCIREAAKEGLKAENNYGN